MPADAPSRPAVVAHRGASAHALEHTLKAYDLALDMGADALEVDVRSTAGGDLIAIHDATLERTAGKPVEVAEATLADLAAVPEPVRPPALEAVFRRYARSTRYWVDMKAPDPEAEHTVIDLVARLGVASCVGIQSFDPECIDRLAAAGAAQPLVQLYRRAVPPDVVLADLDRVAGRAIAIGRAHELVDDALVAAARERGLAVHVYTVNEDEEIERAIGLGAAALITDRPDRARTVVDRPEPAAASP